MKKSSSIQLLFVNTIVLGVSGCDSEPPPVDPCNSNTFEAATCESAVANRGYHYHGTWIPIVYPNPYLFYYGGYTRHIGAGLPVYNSPQSVYARNYSSLDARASAYADRAAPRGTQLSPNRMSSIIRRPASIARSRSGSTSRRGGFGSIGSRRSSFGG
jgi:uncharacterized protein YgiB involved in biofilm formation